MIYENRGIWYTPCVLPEHIHLYDVLTFFIITVNLYFVND